MIKLEDLKVGDYVGYIYSDAVVIVKKINKKSFTTTVGLTIFENEFRNCFVLTEDEARASIFHKYNQELKELDENLKSLETRLDFILKINPYYEVNTEKIEEKINDILENIKEKLENEK